MQIFLFLALVSSVTAFRMSLSASSSTTTTTTTTTTPPPPTTTTTTTTTPSSTSSRGDCVLDLQFGSGKDVTIIGFGSLLSITSSKSTFPELKNFRLVRVHDFRRVFQHPAFIFFERGIAVGNRTSSLSTEPVEGSSFLGVAFEIEGCTKEDFVRREEEFDFRIAKFTTLQPSGEGQVQGQGIICGVATDDLFIERWGVERYSQCLEKYGLTGIWENNTSILPCTVYLRHCVLAAKSVSDECLASFLDDTLLVDRKTTIRDYLAENPDVMSTLPPDSLIGRYSG